MLVSGDTPNISGLCYIKKASCWLVVLCSTSPNFSRCEKPQLYPVDGVAPKMATISQGIARNSPAMVTIG